jgi:hypothetical protein
MSRIHRFVAFGVVLLVGSLAFAGGDKEQAASGEATAWLAVVDGGRYGESWDRASSIFRSAIGRDGWVAALAQTRAPLGHLKSRRLKSATFTTQPPGAPAGQYVIVQFESSFDHLPSGIETVTPALDADGKWRVAGYFIKPGP